MSSTLICDLCKERVPNGNVYKELTAINRRVGEEGSFRENGVESTHKIDMHPTCWAKLVEWMKSNANISS